MLRNFAVYTKVTAVKLTVSELYLNSGFVSQDLFMQQVDVIQKYGVLEFCQNAKLKNGNFKCIFRVVKNWLKSL